MSTKIYQAYRVPQEKFPEAIKMLHKILLDKALEHYKIMMDEVKDNKVREKWNLPQDEPVNFHAKALAVSELIQEIYKKDNIDLFGCGFNFWYHDDMVYIIPWGMPGITDALDDVTFPSWIEEYCYYNNTDKPEHVTDKEWDERAKIWKKIGPNDNVVEHFRFRMQHQVVSASHFSGMVVLENEYRKRYIKQQ